MGHFDHFHHERRTPSFEVVACSDTREDTVHQTDFGLLGRHKTAGLGKNSDQRNRSKIGGFTAHVGACDEEETSLLIHGDVVGYESGLRFQNGMSSAFQMYLVFVRDVWFGPVSFSAHRGKALQNIDACNTTSDVGQHRRLRATIGAQFEEASILEFFQF